MRYYSCDMAAEENLGLSSASPHHISKIILLSKGIKC
jgi:hypothetical protein